MASVTIEELKKKRSAAKRKITLKINDTITPLLTLKGKEACESANEFKEAISELENRFSAFKLAHEAYVNQLEDETEEENLDNVLKAEEDYSKEVYKNVHDTLKKVKGFDEEVKDAKSAESKNIDVKKAQAALKDAFEDYNEIVRDVSETSVDAKPLLEAEDLSSDQIDQILLIPATEKKVAITTSYQIFTRCLSDLKAASGKVGVDHTKFLEELKIDVSHKLIPESIKLRRHEEHHRHSEPSFSS